jgi:hypothetical protein
MKGKGDKGGKSKRQNAQFAQSEFDSFAFFFFKISITPLKFQI